MESITVFGKNNLAFGSACLWLAALIVRIPALLLPESTCLLDAARRIFVAFYPRLVHAKGYSLNGSKNLIDGATKRFGGKGL